MADISDSNKSTIKPWYRWHVTRWRNSPRVLSMSLAAQGAYRNLLDAAWENGARLPNNPEVLWRYALAVSAAEFSKIAPQIMSMFKPSDDGKWLLNDTLTSEWNDASEWYKKKSEAGKKGASARWPHSGEMAVPSQPHGDAITVPMAKHGTLPYPTVQNSTQVQKPSAPKPRGPRPNSGMARSTGETRHVRLQQVIMGWYQEWAGAECPWNGAEGKQLQSLITSTPGWVDPQFITCLDNLAKSAECVSRGSPPREWLAKLPKFLHSPLDRFWKPISNGVNGNGSNGNGNSKAAERINRNRQILVSEITGSVGHQNDGHNGAVVQPRTDAGIGSVLERGVSGFNPKADK